ncbi:hypothetical protein [Bacillus cereus]
MGATSRTDEAQFNMEPGSSRILKKLEESMVTDKGVTSTSFALLNKHLGGEDKNILLEITVPKLSPAIYLENE